MSRAKIHAERFHALTSGKHAMAPMTRSRSSGVSVGSQGSASSLIVDLRSRKNRSYMNMIPDLEAAEEAQKEPLMERMRRRCNIFMSSSTAGRAYYRFQELAAVVSALAYITETYYIKLYSDEESDQVSHIIYIYIHTYISYCLQI